MSEVATLSALLAAGRPAERHAPWPRRTLDAEGWLALRGLLAGEPDIALLALWGEEARVHAAVRDEMSGEVAVLSVDCQGGGFASLGAVRPGAIRLERAIFDLFGLVPEGLADGRPWLDHGTWPRRHPLAAVPADPLPPEPYAFLACEGESLHQIPVGPVHAGIIEPGHFRFTASGETVVRLEERLGYVHKGIEGLMAGAPVGRAARLAARISGDSTVAWSLAFARAAEAATGTAVPPRAHALRALMAELERIANHLGDIGAVCNDASFVFMHAQCAILRERILRLADAAFGHRLMMDRIVPGGTAADLTEEGARAVTRLAGEVGRRFAALVRIYDGEASLIDRTVGTGIVSAALAHRFAAGGHVGRASGRAFDTRRALPYPPYDGFDLAVPVFTEGDVNARVWVRIREVEASLGMVTRLAERLPDGPVASPLQAAPEPAEGMAMVESFRGDVFVWLRILPDGTVARCHPRDPSWFQWPLLEAAIEGNIVADFPLCNKSFNCSYAGQDL